jgi:hypothetical protein
MPTSMSRVAAGLDIAIVIDAPPGRVLKAFFEHEALNAWWQVARSVTTPRMLGPYAIEWAPTDFRDAVLGRLGGVFRGTVMQFQDGRGFFVADAFWLPPDGDPIGPMSLEVACALVEPPRDGRLRPPGSVATRVRVTQTGFEESVRWRRYYEVVNDGWERALESLKSLLEH